MRFQLVPTLQTCSKSQWLSLALHSVIETGPSSASITFTDPRKPNDVVVSCVNNVGVELNTASKHLLTYISGLNARVAANIVAHRDEHGPFGHVRRIGMAVKLSETPARWDLPAAPLNAHPPKWAPASP